jgi:hypothetical protein
MATKTITFEILGEAILNQSFSIPENYDVNGKSTEELYHDIVIKFGSDFEPNVLCEDICPIELNYDNDIMAFSGFAGYHTEKDGWVLDSYI